MKKDKLLSLAFLRKSKFNPKQKHDPMDNYLSRLQEEISPLNKKLNYSNQTKEERQATYSLTDDTLIIIKEADKGSGIVVWDREDYSAEGKST